MNISNKTMSRLFASLLLLLPSLVRAQTVVGKVDARNAGSTVVTGNSITNPLSTWISYIAGASNPNPILLGSSLGVTGASTFSGTVGGAGFTAAVATAAPVKTVAGRTGTVTIASGDVSGLGTAATVNTGTSGATIPLLNGANTWGAAQHFGAQTVDGSGVAFTGGTLNGLTHSSGILSGTFSGSPTLTGALTLSGASTSLSVTGGAGYSNITTFPILASTFPSGNTNTQTHAQLTTSASGGTTGNVYTLQRNDMVISGAPNAYWWVGLDTLNYSGTGGTGQHVARYAQTTRYTYNAGGTTANPQLWAMVSENDDFTGVKSSLTNAQVTHEFDLTGHNVDNAANRQMISGVIAPAADNNNYFEANNGYGLTVSAGAYVRRMAGFGGAYTLAAFDIRYTSSYGKNTSSLTTPTYPTVTSAVISSTTIPVSNVMPFTSDIYGRDINGGFTNTIFFSDGQSANITAYNITGSGPTPAGTLTVSSAISEASGNTVYNNSRAIWLGTGFQIALDNNGVTNISSDGTTITLTGGVNATGGYKVNGVAGADCPAGTVSLTTLIIVKGMVTHC
jgi:hypothetical protein